MLLVLGLKGVIYDGHEVSEEFYPDNLLLDVPDYTDPENLDEILSTLAKEWFMHPEGKEKIKGMLPKQAAVDYYVTNIMFNGRIYSSDDPVYKSIFDSIGVIYTS